LATLPTTSSAQTSVTISGDLITHVHFIYQTAKQTNNVDDFAIPAYILAVAAVEAFVNEMFLSGFASLVLGESRLLPEEAEKLDLLVKSFGVRHSY
jgi:hypothetical protein